MAYTTIDDPSVHFQTALYTGNATNGKAITNDGNSDLQPDWVWIKCRSDTANHNCSDSSRGATKHLAQNIAGAEETVSGITGYNSDGFTLGTNGDSNGNNKTFVGWQWKANGGTTANQSGNIASVSQANTTSGFSIVTYTGNGGSGQSVNHGIGSAPEWVIVKRRNGSADWFVYHVSLGNTKHLHLNTTAAQSTTSDWGNTTPSALAFFVNNTATCIDGETYVAYCFAPVQGYSMFSSYTGNGGATAGPFVYLGFKPAWVMIKSAKDANGDGWHILDNKREKTANPTVGKLFADSNQSEAASTAIGLDLLSNGFKVRATDGGLNRDNDIYVFMAFAESPFVTSTGIPTTAR